MAVAVRTEPSFTSGNPELLFEGPYFIDWTEARLRNYDIAPDGKRFLMVKNEEGAAPNELIVVLNWFEELKRLAPAEH